MNYGYARVSSKDQNLDRQIEALVHAGVDKKQIHVEKVSGKDFDRKKYKQLYKKLKQGDVLFIKSIDRLGRNYNEIMEQWRLINRVKKVDIVVLDFDLLDTRQYINGLTGQFISDMVLQILSYVAQVERENILERQKEGIRIAHEKGIKFGRPKKAFPPNFSGVYNDWKQHKISKREAARRLHANTTLFTRWANDYEKEAYPTYGICEQ